MDMEAMARAQAELDERANRRARKRKEAKERAKREWLERVDRRAAERNKNPVHRARRWQSHNLPPVPPPEADWRPTYVRFGEAPRTASP